nr:protein phosphatase 2 (formerly 2A) regulatory [Hymenolepis microstoma]CUU99516.1 protein phosphatase 2 (formerly 2A) regulatory [Hymenolepis microstoma]
MDEAAVDASVAAMAVNEVDDAFKLYYVSSIVCTFFFFLDPLRADRIRICNMPASVSIETLLQLADAPRLRHS